MRVIHCKLIIVTQNENAVSKIVHILKSVVATIIFIQTTDN